MAIPKPKPEDWIRTNAQRVQKTDREVLAMLRDSYRRVGVELEKLVSGEKATASANVRRAQLEQSRTVLLREQARIFERLGDITEAARLEAAAEAQRLSAAADAALLRLVGKSGDAQTLYDAALQASQRAVDVAMARMRLSEMPLSTRIYRAGVYMNGRLSKLINEQLAIGLNAREFAKKARNWFNPATPGGVRYAAMRLARTEINNAFHAMSVEKAVATPWIENMEWHLSDSHPKPDECNEFAAHNTGLGAGVYKAEDVPARPHPQCMCYVTPEPIEEDAFVENFLNGDYDEYLDDELEKVGVPKDTTPVLSVVPDLPTSLGAPLEGDAAHAIVPKGLFKRGSLNPQQRKSLATYETGWFMFINNFLRGKTAREDIEDSDVEIIAQIDSAMEESVLPQDIVVYRGLFRAGRMFGDRFGNDLSGFSWKEEAYSSTTTEKKITNFFNVEAEDPQSRFFKGNVQMTVRVAAGVKALETSTSSKGSKANGPQAEITLQRNLEWKVVKDNGYDANGIRQLEVEANPVGTRDERSQADGGTPARQLQSSSPARADQSESARAAEIAAKAEAEYVPASLAKRPELEDFIKSRTGTLVLGVDDNKMKPARDLSESEVMDLLLQGMIRELSTTSYLPTYLQLLRAVDEQYAVRSATRNEHFFEQKIVAYLTTPEGVAKSREVQEQLGPHLEKFRKADELSRLAEQLNGAQPELPSDSAQYQEWDRTKAASFWDQELRRQPLTDEQRKALRYYSTSPGYQAMNEYLRFDSGSAKEKARAQVENEHARSAMRPLTEPALVTRYARESQFADQGAVYQRKTDLAGLVGQTFKDNGFTSTSVKGGKITGQSVKLEIELPVGLPVAYLEKLTSHKGENEILLTDGVEFKVLQSKYDEELKKVRMRVRVVNWPGKVS